MSCQQEQMGFFDARTNIFYHVESKKDFLSVLRALEQEKKMREEHAFRERLQK